MPDQEEINRCLFLQEWLEPGGLDRLISGWVTIMSFNEKDMERARKKKEEHETALPESKFRIMLVVTTMSLVEEA